MDSRYELGGVPLPYSSSSPLFKKLFPTAPTTRTPDDQEEPDFAQHLNISSIPPCPRCKSERTFELQLVPSLISTLSPDSLSTTGKAEKKAGGKKQSEDERKKELAKLAGGVEGEEDGLGMEWGSVVVFGCKRDCVGFGEEWVGVEWEALLSNP
jgi:pre-rRNA-processing protein TSR4